MKVRFDEQADAFYIRLDDARIEESDEVSPGFTLDFDADNRVIGIELSQVLARLPTVRLKQMQFEVA
ncbi:MAG: DUF2283 domain-containing protein [Rhodospirillaceae bacterium]